MEPILSKEEIADLLAAVKEGRVSTETPSEKKHGDKAGQRPDTQLLNLCTIYQQAEKSDKRLPNFDLTLDGFSHNFGISLTNTLQRTFHVRRQSMDGLPFQTILAEFSNQGAIAVIKLEPLKFGAVLHFDSVLAFTLLEIMLGAPIDNASSLPDRPLTTLELTVLKGLFSSACLDLQRAFQPIVDLTASLVKVEQNARLANIVDADVESLVSRFTVKIGNQKGEMRLVIPYVALEPLKKKLRNMAGMSTTTSAWSDLFAREALEMPGEIRVCSGPLTMTIREIQEMRPGDIVRLNYDPNHPLTLLVADKAKFTAIPGERGGKKAVQITGRHPTTCGENHGSP